MHSYSTNKPEDAQKIGEWLDKMKQEVIEALNHGVTITLHMHSSWFDIGTPVRDMLLSGFTYGVSRGDYPHAGNTKELREDGIMGSSSSSKLSSVSPEIADRCIQKLESMGKTASEELKADLRAGVSKE